MVPAWPLDDGQSNVPGHRKPVPSEERSHPPLPAASVKTLAQNYVPAHLQNNPLWKSYTQRCLAMHMLFGCVWYCCCLLSHVFGGQHLALLPCLCLKLRLLNIKFALSLQLLTGYPSECFLQMTKGQGKQHRQPPTATHQS
jgi:hypothetical protein